METNNTTAPPPPPSIAPPSILASAFGATTTNGASSSSSASFDGLPTYDLCKADPAWARGRALLAVGDYDASLTALGDALKESREALPADLPDRDLHESLGPLYYSYGSTLLYKLEEDEEEAERGGVGANVDNVRLALEVLQGARIVLERLCANADRVTDAHREDLAWVRLRSGDGRRRTGEFDKATEDYRVALRLRTDLFGQYHRSVADCHHMLAVTELSAAFGPTADDLAEENNNGDGDGDDGKDLQDALFVAGQEGSVFRREVRREALKNKALAHFRACGRSLGGLVAKSCGEPLPFDEEDDDEVDGDPAEECAALLESIVKSVRPMRAASPDDAHAVADLKGLLDDIFQTVKAVANDGFQDDFDTDEEEEVVNAMLAEAAAADDGDTDDDEDDEDGAYLPPADYRRTEEERYFSPPPPHAAGGPHKMPVAAEAGFVNEVRIEGIPGDAESGLTQKGSKYDSVRALPGRSFRASSTESLVVVPETAHHRSSSSRTICRKESLCGQCVVQ